MITGLSIVARSPLWSDETAVIDSALGFKASGYSHEIQANGGYWSASIEFADHLPAVWEWLSNGVGRHIDVYGSNLEKIWEGCVNRVRVTAGPVSAESGPLLDIANYVKVVYQTVTYNTNPPVGGQRATSDPTQDTDSQALYGRLEAILNAGTGTAVQMAEIQATYLAEYKNPDRSLKVSTGGGEPTISLECIGYGQLLSKYYYDDTGTGTQNASAKLQAVLEADPNGLYTTFSGIETNTTQVSQFDGEERTAWDAIRGIVALGDGSANRSIFGVLEDRIPYYKSIPTTIDYTMQLSDPGQWVLDSAGNRVYPWQVQAGKWLQITDMIPGETGGTSLRTNPRNVFIENVKYSTPWKLSINGGKVGSIGQLLARLGTGGQG